jgi:hypothetical protein
MTAPKRQRRDDRLIHPGATETEIRCDRILGPFDTAARAMDLKWGVDRLPELVTPETADRWGKAMANLNAAIAAQDPETLTARVSACIRGFAAMDAEAAAAGHQPITPRALEFTLDGKTCAILKDDAAWPAYAAQRPGVRIVGLGEIINALRLYDSAVTTAAPVVAAFPGATITSIRQPSPLAQALNDDIPFSPETRA